MLQPTNRLTLIDAMRPPAGFRLESAMAVTFTLNLQALLAAPAAFAIAGLGNSTNEPIRQRPVELIHALRTNAHKLTVFSEVGAIGLPPPSRAFAFLERAVVPVQAPRGGIVHPKVWVLRYEAPTRPEEVTEGDRRHRVLITSRNLTFDTSWDTVLRLDESADSHGADLGAVGKLFLGLVGNAAGTISEDHLERVGSLAASLQTARFALPDGVDELSIHVLGLDGTKSPLPSSVDRSLIVSPFVTDGFFSRLAPRPVSEVVSRQGSLGQLSESTLDPIGKVWVLDSTLDDLSTSDSADTPDDPKPPQHSPDDPGRPLAGLHAKVFAFEHGDRARLFVGSANATGPAFGRNLEILAELRGPVAALGIDQLCDGNGDEPGLRNLFRPYTRDGSNGPNGPTDGLGHVRRAIARLPITGSVEKSGEGWAVTYRSAQRVPTVKDTEIHCRPLTTPGNRRSITPGEPFEERFETSLEGISGFLAFELKDNCGEETGFVVPVPLEGVPEHRDGHLLRALIGSAERFLRYLLALLYEGSTGIELSEAITNIDAGEVGTGAARAVNLAALEPLLRAMRRDPSKLVGLHPLVADLGADGALPEGFAELWEAIREVAVEGTGTR